MVAEHSNRFALIGRIVEKSEADTWELAKREWTLTYVWFVEDGEGLETCLCGHYPIKEVCVISNLKNGKTAEVGNVCVNRFLKLGSKIIFDGIKRISKDVEKALNAAATEYAFKQRWITAWEKDFCHDTTNKRNLSSKQMQKRSEINRRVLVKMRKRPASSREI